MRLRIELVVDEPDNDYANLVVYNLPYGGTCENEIAEWFNELVVPIITALVEKKRSDIEAEFSE